MALKTKDIRSMNAPDRVKALVDARSELMHQRGLAAMGGAVKNPGQIRDLRTTIARILTIEHQISTEGPKPGKTRASPAPKQAKKPAPKAKAPAKAPQKAAKPAKPAKAAPKQAKAAPKKTGGTR